MNGFGFVAGRKQAKESDVVFTPDLIALDMVTYFNVCGRVLDPCRGAGAFWRCVPGAFWCEITEGLDFFDWKNKVDWVIGNPPYSILTEWLQHSFDLVDDVIYLIPLTKLFGSEGRMKLIFSYGGIVEIRVYGAGRKIGFPLGFVCGAVHFRRGFMGDTKWTFYKGKYK